MLATTRRSHAARSLTRRWVVLATLVVFMVAMLQAASPASSREAGEATVRWDNRTFATATALASHVAAKGVDPERFFRGHPGVVTTFGLKSIQWDGLSFYTVAGMKRWHARQGTSFARWGDNARFRVRNAEARTRSQPSLEQAMSGWTLRPNGDGASRGHWNGHGRLGSHRLEWQLDAF